MDEFPVNNPCALFQEASLLGGSTNCVDVNVLLLATFQASLGGQVLYYCLIKRKKNYQGGRVVTRASMKPLLSETVESPQSDLQVLLTPALFIAYLVLQTLQ